MWIAPTRIEARTLRADHVKGIHPAIVAWPGSSLMERAFPIPRVVDYRVVFVEHRL
jgi:hypothetical protein